MSANNVYANKQRIRFHRLNGEMSVLGELTGLGYDLAQLLTLMALGAIYLGQRRMFSDETARAGEIARLHLEPRRFQSALHYWPSRVVALTESWVVVNKPANVPVHATLDNAKENMLAELETLFRQKLFITHRLDLETQGLVMIARRKEMQRRLNRWLTQKRISRRYRAQTRQAVALGAHQHFMLKSPRAPKIITGDENDLRCEMKVLRCDPQGSGFALEIELTTGRTHQIRAQLAALKAPLVGDEMYGGVAHHMLALQAAQLSLRPLGLSFILPPMFV